MRTKKAALGFAPREAARESSPRQPRSLEEPDAPRNSTRRRLRGPAKWRSLRELVDDGLLSTFVELGGAVLADARRRRAEALLRDEAPADEAQERRAWNDRERAS